MKNYRPVSNLNFISKIIEKIISNRIRSHLDKNNLSNPNQSAYKPLHSTETALLKIHNDICMNMYTGKTSIGKLKLNPDKTDFILISTKAQRDKFKKYFPTKLLDQDVTPTDSARNLGVEFDKDFNFKKHISKVCRSCYYHIRDLRRLRRCLTAAVTKTIATSLVSSS